jgi:cytochrome c oxidase subunit III
MASTTQTMQPLHSAVAVSEGATTAERTSASGIWVAMFAITMTFAAFTSALFIRQASTDWGHLIIPKVLIGNTIILVLSGFVLESGRRRLLESEGGRSKGLMFVGLTLVLGLIFLGGQYLAWRQLAAQGLYLATNPNSSFFYVFTFMHALHVLGGILALAFLCWHIFLNRSVRRSLLSGVATYWHFMAALWVYLLIVMYSRL